MRDILSIFLVTLLLFSPTAIEARSKPRKISKAEVAAAESAEAMQNALNAELIEAVERNQMVECLNRIGRGANPNIKDSDDTPLLLIAIRQKQHKIMKTLLESGADCTATDASGIFPLAQVILNGSDGSLPEILLTPGIEINQKDGAGRTALHMAAERNQKVAIELLISHGAFVDVKDNRGRTALMYSCKSGAADACKALLKAQADLNAQDEDGQTVLMFTVQSEQPELVSFLINQGAAIDTMDDFGATALKIAEALGHQHSADCLRNAYSR